MLVNEPAVADDDRRLEERMPRGTITSFNPSRGFGTLLLDTGEEVPFDISASNKREIHVGDSADVTLGVGRSGKPKAKLVVFELEEDRAPAFAEGLRELQKLGFLVGWDLKQARAAARELFDEIPRKLTRRNAGALFESYYGEGLSERGKAEGVIVLDWRVGQVTSTPAEDVLAIAPSSVSVNLGHDGDQVSVGGEKVDLSEGLQPLLEAFNRSAGIASSGGRFFSLDFDSDAHVVVHRQSAFADEVNSSRVLRLMAV